VTKKLCPRLAIALLAFLFLVNLYRAWTQSITCDEAFAHSLFLSGPASLLFTSFDASHHVLHTILCRISISLFGLSEFTLRIPSLLGGVLYFSAVYRLCRFLFGESWLFLLSTAVLSLNPFLLDFLSAARGYGLALGFCLWGMEGLIRYLSAPADRRPLRRAAFSLALSVASNLTFLFPNAALALVFLALLLAENRIAWRRQAAAAIQHFCIPGLATASLILILPLTKARREHFHMGVSSLAEMADSLAHASLVHHPERWAAAGGYSVLMWCVWVIGRMAAPALLAVVAILCIGTIYQWARSKSPEGRRSIDRFLLLVGGASLLTLLLSVAAHRAFGLLYPVGRTGLYWIVLLPLLSAGMAKKLEGSIARAPLLLFLSLCTAWFALEFKTSHYAWWRYDAGTKRIVQRIREMHSGRESAKVKVGVTWFFEPSMNFYRRLYGLDWMAPLTRDGPDGAYDYFIVQGEEAAMVKKRGWRRLYTDPISGAVLAVPDRAKK